MTNSIIRIFILGFLIITIFSLNLNAQRTLGFKGGINFSDFYDHPESEMITGLKAGAFKDFYIGERFIVSLGMYYSNEGAIIKDVIFTNGAGYDHAEIFETSRGYLEMPLYIGFQFFLNKNMILKPYAGFNLTLSVVTDKSESSNITPIPDPQSSTDILFDMGEKVLETDQKYGLIIGLELTYDNQFIFDISYNRFFGPVLTASTLTHIDYRTHYVNISIGLFIN